MATGKYHEICQTVTEKNYKIIQSDRREKIENFANLQHEETMKFANQLQKDCKICQLVTEKKKI